MLIGRLSLRSADLQLWRRSEAGGSSRPRTEEVRFIIFHPAVDNPWAERNNRSEKDQGATSQGPAGRESGVQQGGAKNHKENSMCHSYDLHHLRLSPDIFEGHGNKEEDEIGNALDESDAAQECDRVFHWIDHDLLCDELLFPIAAGEVSA